MALARCPWSHGNLFLLTGTVHTLRWRGTVVPAQLALRAADGAAPDTVHSFTKHRPLLSAGRARLAYMPQIPPRLPSGASVREEDKQSQSRCPTVCLSRVLWEFRGGAASPAGCWAASPFQEEVVWGRSSEVEELRAGEVGTGGGNGLHVRRD